jgi:hypothetical protein
MSADHIAGSIASASPQISLPVFLYLKGFAVDFGNFGISGNVLICVYLRNLRRARGSSSLKRVGAERQNKRFAFIRVIRG